MKFRIIGVLSLWSSLSSAYCFNEAAATYHQDPVLLQAIAIRESRLNPKAINDKNTNGSVDYCLMQVNSGNMGRLKAFNITPDRLLKEPCLCVATGAYILAGWFKEFGYNWEAVGAYNAGGSPKRALARKRYSNEIKSIYYVLNQHYNRAPLLPYK